MGCCSTVSAESVAILKAKWEKSTIIVDNIGAGIDIAVKLNHGKKRKNRMFAIEPMLKQLQEQREIMAEVHQTVTQILAEENEKHCGCTKRSCKKYTAYMITGFSYALSLAAQGADKVAAIATSFPVFKWLGMGCSIASGAGGGLSILFKMEEDNWLAVKKDLDLIMAQQGYIRFTERSISLCQEVLQPDSPPSSPLFEPEEKQPLTVVVAETGATPEAHRIASLGMPPSLMRQSTAQPRRASVQIEIGDHLAAAIAKKFREEFPNSRPFDISKLAAYNIHILSPSLEPEHLAERERASIEELPDHT